MTKIYDYFNYPQLKIISFYHLYIIQFIDLYP